MTKLKTWLIAVLALQLFLAGSLMAFNYQREAGSEPVKLFDKNSVTVNRIEISDGKQSITVAKQGDNWQLPDQSELPATESKVTATIDSIADLAMVWPVSTTSSSHERFEVADDKFQREVKLYAGANEIAHFYLGTSPGFRKVHFRQAGADEVYAVSLNTFDFPVAADEWLEKSLLDVADVDSIQGPDFRIKKDGDDWQFDADSVTATETASTLNEDKAKQLATAFSNFHVTDFSDTAPTGEPISMEVAAAGNTWQFKFYQADDKYYVQRNDMPQTFSLSKYDFERIAGVKKETLVLAVENNTESDADENAASLPSVDIKNDTKPAQ